jgi:putative ABC transport system ATP-binding protein
MPVARDVALATSDVSLRRHGRIFARFPDLQLRTGEAVALTGASGSGKTTALLALAGLRAPAGGAVSIAGTDLWALPATARDRLRGRGIGMVFQSFHLIDAMTVEDNLRLASSCAGMPTDTVHLDGLLEALAIADLRGRRVDRLSQGQAQRVAVARALVNRPHLILADEPTSALDDDNATRLLALLRSSTARCGAALLVATHDRRTLGVLDRAIALEAA